MAPDWLLNQLPCMPLDGELWAGRGNFQALRSIVSRDVPDERWHGVQYVLFGCPPVAEVFSTRAIKKPQCHLSISATESKEYIRCISGTGALEDFESLPHEATFLDELRQLETGVQESANLFVHHQEMLATNPIYAQNRLDTILAAVLKNGGEGVMLRAPDSQWVACRTHNLLKLKPFQDDESVVVGYVAGRGKFAGLIGALITCYNGKRLELSGLTDEERQFESTEAADWAQANPGQIVPAEFNGKYTKVGVSVTFRFRELSDAGIPKEARYMRIR